MKKLLVLAITCLVSFAFVSCGGGGSSAAKDDGTITLEFQQWWGVELPDGALQDLVQGFTDATGIKIKLLSNPYADTKVQIAAGASAGTMADVVGLDGAWVYDFARQEAIANLTELMNATGYDSTQLSDQIKYNGSTYMIPVVNFAYPMYVNMDLLKAAGITSVPSTRDEFLAAAKQIKAANPNAAGWAIPLSIEAPSGIQNQFMSWLWASGGSMLKDGKPNLVGNKDLESVVEFVKALFDANLVSSGAFAMKEPDMVEEFANNRLAFMISGVSHLNMINKEAPNLDLAFMPVPAVSGYNATRGIDVASWGIGVSANSKYQAESMQFVEYMMSPEVNAKLSAMANAFPGNVNSNPDYSSSPALFQDAYEIFKGSYAVNEFTGLPTAEDLMRSFSEELQLYLDGDTATVAEMLANTQKRWEPAFK